MVLVLVVSDNPLARGGLEALLTRVPGAELRASVAVPGAVAAAAETGPEAVLLDLEGLDEDALTELAESLTPLPVVGIGAEGVEVAAALEAGVAAVLGVDCTPEEVSAAFSAAAAGLVALRRADFGSIRPAASHHSLDMPVESLTRRESEILQLMAQGLTNRRIAARLGISDHTVKFHCTAILGKLGAATRAEAVARSAGLGWLLV